MTEPFAYVHYGRGPTVVRGWGDHAHASRQSESGIYEDEVDEGIRGWRIAALSPRIKSEERLVYTRNEPHAAFTRSHTILPDFVLVRDGQGTAHIEYTPSHTKVSGSKPLPAAKLALANMRTWMERMVDPTWVASWSE